MMKGKRHTNHQILSLWTLGNNSADGIKAFVRDHRCNEVCKAIGLPEVGDSEWENNIPQESVNPTSESQTANHTTPAPRAPRPSGSLTHLLVDSDDDGVLPDPNVFFATHSSFKTLQNTST
ncbi:Eukaryotic elongation factor-2 kinase [Puccinia graminis f. sp. tritici]|uniref:Eukaryotic elongation factor-2 kinase n=1 Tax=Puccinia graminis f. sp. tritici TaxID=56615 RepID=A0A5B0PH38_PUCGR|nr:Eukaryotic elongation factor-2 kinase [Puccinia graminis f. sp. tritici]